jgi:HEAT repeat protein
VLPATLKQLRSDDPTQRTAALADIACQGGEEAFRLITDSFDDPSPQVRVAAARALCDLQPDRTSSFTRALREASAQRRGWIGTAMADSGLANDAIHDLVGESREKTYSASSLLFLMVKAGEVQPLVKALENHQNLEVRLTAITLLATSGHPDTIAVLRRVAVRASLPSEVRSAAMEGLHQITANAQFAIE